MSKPPPKKKFRQLPITDLFKSSAVKDIASSSTADVPCCANINCKTRASIFECKEPNVSNVSLVFEDKLDSRLCEKTEIGSEIITTDIDQLSNDDILNDYDALKISIDLQSYNNQLVTCNVEEFVVDSLVDLNQHKTITQNSIETVLLEDKFQQEIGIKMADSRRLRMAEAAEKRMKHVCSDTETSKTTEETDNSNSSCDMFADEHIPKCSWQGVPLSTLSCLTYNNLNVPTVTPSPVHSVLVHLPLNVGAPPSPFPSNYDDIWDSDHVRLPCSPDSQYPKEPGSQMILSRWSVVCEALQAPILNVNDLLSAVLRYNHRYKNKWHFNGLEQLLEQEFLEEECEHFFSSTLPSIVRLALRLPELLTRPPPLLKRHYNQSVSLSQLQVASLMANAFLCTFPRRNATRSHHEYNNYPDINFNRLFSHKEQKALEKMKCLLNYFRRVAEIDYSNTRFTVIYNNQPAPESLSCIRRHLNGKFNPFESKEIHVEMKQGEPIGLMTFSRQYVDYPDIPKWESAPHPLTKLYLDSSKVIEEAQGLLQVDFANKFMGGGVLGLGCVQEEIRFVLCPELIISRLFTEALDKTEALIVTGIEQYNCSKGYASEFTWMGSHYDSTPRDPWGRRLCQLVAIDALHFSRNPQAQYSWNQIYRELNKAYAGFAELPSSRGSLIAVATGNWGCGAFKGDPRLKALIQLAVCGYVGRDVAYFTFKDEKLQQELMSLHEFLKENNVTVGTLVQMLNRYSSSCKIPDGKDLWKYIYHNVSGYNADTGDEADGEGSCSTVDVKFKMKKRSLPVVMDKISKYFQRPVLEESQVKVGKVGSSDSLMEEKILQALEECDKVMEEGRGSSCGVSRDGEMDASEGRMKEKEEKKDRKKMDEKKEKSSRLLMALDRVDKVSF